MGKLTLNWAKLKPEVKQVWQLSLPAILTQITTIAMQYIDSAMVGALGAAASAAIGLVVAMTWLYNGVLSAVSAGFSVQVAHHIGAGQDSDARNVIRHGLISALIISGLLCLSGLLLSHPLPIVLGGDPAICPDATAYFFVYSLMIPFSQLNSLTSAFLQCSGDMVTPSILNAVMCVLDILFNSLLIPRFGVLGAGMGTALACAIISLIMAWRCCICNKQLHLRRTDKHHFDRNILRKAFQIGMPVAVQEIAMNGAMVVSTRIIAHWEPLPSLQILSPLPQKVCATCQAMVLVWLQPHWLDATSVPENLKQQNVSVTSVPPWVPFSWAAPVPL